MIPPTTLSAWSELAARATPGPWEPNVWIETDGNEWRATGPGHEDSSGDYDSAPGCPDEQAAQADAAFIAASRTAMPALLAEVERLKSERDALFEERMVQHHEEAPVRRDLRFAKLEIERLKSLLAEACDIARHRLEVGAVMGNGDEPGLCRRALVSIAAIRQEVEL
jgi:hypothetical protein